MLPQNLGWSTKLLLGLSVIVMMLAGSFGFAEEDAPAPAREFRAVTFGSDETANTIKLSKLAADGWEYVGPLGAGMVAFRSAAKAAVSDAAKLSGVWINVYTELDGKRRNPDSRHVFVGNRYFRIEGNRIAEDGTFVVDDSGPLKKIDYTVLRGEDEGFTWHAVYDLDGDTFRHFGRWGTENWENRPAAFSDKTDATTFLRVMKRETVAHP